MDAIENRIHEIMAIFDALPRRDMIRAKCDQLLPVSAWKTKTVVAGGLRIPGFRYADGPRGVGDRTTPPANGHGRGKATCFPARINQASTWNPELAEEVNRAMADEFVASGVNVILNCSVDLLRDPRTGRAQETLGEDPYLAGRIATSSVKGTQAAGAIACVKHYNLNFIERDRGMMFDYWRGRVADCRIDRRTLVEHYGLPFRAAIQQGRAMSVMAAYNKVNGEKCTENRALLTEVLRDLWGFEYWVVSDWAGNVSGHRAFHAGLDLDESFYFPSQYRQRLKREVRQGKIETAALDRSVRRVLRTKLESRIMDFHKRFAPVGVEVINCAEHRALAKTAALESIVLLENRNGFLPVAMNRFRKIAVIGPNAHRRGALLGDNWMGSSFVDAAHEVTALDGLRDKIGGDRVIYRQGCGMKHNFLDRFLMARAIKIAKTCDLVVFVGGINYEIEGEARDRRKWTIELPGKQVRLINSLKTLTGKPVVVVLAGSGAMAVSRFVDNVDGLIFAGYPGMEAGNAIADIIFGDYNPDAKLAMTFPRRDADMPKLGKPGDRVFDFSRDITDGVGYRYYDRKGIVPQYAFGFGLSYTAFRIDNLKINGMTVSVEVTNTGDRPGKETVQLYLSHDPGCTVPMPVKQLKGFRKIFLNPGETATVTMELTDDDLAYYDVGTKSYRTEGGVYAVRVGNSSDSLLLCRGFSFLP